METKEIEQKNPLISDWLQSGADALRDGFDKPEHQYSKSGEDFKLSKAIVDPEFYATNVTRAVPQLLSTLIPALGAAKGIGAIDRVSKMPKVVKTMLQVVGGAGVNTAIDSSIEAGSVYDEAISRGMTDEQANEAADGAFLKNMALTGGTSLVEFGLGLLPFGKTATGVGKTFSLAGRTAGGAIAEGFREGAQDWISSSELGTTSSGQTRLQLKQC